ncbi:PTS transporter subunit IIC [Rhodohalobacter sp. 8-1]|uniref:PTS transporter subunit IIC n=1 Tax=Rhodohalobacter sp. 8-1 TaxID=3131972 RepID=UPI0030EED337
MLSFLKKKGVELSLRTYLVTALSYMALGLFSSLIIGLIIRTAGQQTGIEMMIRMGQVAMDLMGPAIGVAIAYGLKAPPLVMFASAAAGAFGAVSGGPAGAYVAALLATECGKLVAGSTRVDIILTPLATIVVGFFAAEYLGFYIDQGLVAFGELVNWSVEQQPFLMGVLVAALMGLALTAPISSAAIAIMIGLDGLAAGAATVGCSAQMVGFAVSSYRENGVGGFIAQGIGTSMLQIGNVLKHPLIIIPPTLAGAILAPLSTLVFGMQNTPEGAGMGTAGFVGQIFTFTSMGFSWDILAIVIMLHIIGPAILCLMISEFMRRRGWINPGDMTLKTE